MPEPIMKFHSEEEAYSVMMWWKKMLFLDDWIIHVRILPVSAPPLNGVDMGQSDCDHVNNCCLITLAEHDSLDPTCMETLCDEKVLVHEMLHIVYPSIVDTSSYVSAYMDMEEHRKLEKMAKSLMMVKYGIPFEFFDRHWYEKHYKEEKTK